MTMEGLLGLRMSCRYAYAYFTRLNKAKFVKFNEYGVLLAS